MVPNQQSGAGLPLGPSGRNVLNDIMLTDDANKFSSGVPGRLQQDGATIRLRSREAMDIDGAGQDGDFVCLVKHGGGLYPAMDDPLHDDDNEYTQVHLICLNSVKI